jgi:flagellar biosynthesis protein FlhA
VPGLPFLPFMTGAGALGWLAYRLSANQAKAAAQAAAPRATTTPATAPTMGDMLDLDDIHLEFAPDLVEMVLDPALGLDARIASMRQHVAAQYGLILPEIRLTDQPSLAPGTYLIRIQGVEQVRDGLRPGRLLALLSGPGHDHIAGEDVREPVYGAAARWISPGDQNRAALAGLTTVWPAEVLATHLLEVVRRNLARLMSLKTLRRILDEMVRLSDSTRADANRRMLDELIPEKVPVDVLLAVLRLLLDERVSVRNMSVILEAVAEARGQYATPEAIAEHVRQRLGFQLVADLRRSDGTIPLVQLAPEWEDTFTTYQMPSDRGGHDVALPPEEFNRLAAAIADRMGRAAELGAHPALVTSMRRRRFLRTLLTAKGINNPVLSFEEIGLDARPALVGMVAA